MDSPKHHPSTKESHHSTDDYSHDYHHRHVAFTVPQRCEDDSLGIVDRGFHWNLVLRFDPNPEFLKGQPNKEHVMNKVGPSSSVIYFSRCKTNLQHALASSGQDFVCRGICLLSANFHSSELMGIDALVACRIQNMSDMPANAENMSIRFALNASHAVPRLEWLLEFRNVTSIAGTSTGSHDIWSSMEI